MLVVQYGVDLKRWDACVIWGKWRLVSGAELYDIKADPAQKSDVAGERKEVVQKMREHYESWWAGVAPSLNEFQTITIGSPHENPALLVSCDWERAVGDNPVQVLGAEGGPRGGPWNVLVERRSGQSQGRQSGSYRRRAAKRRGTGVL
jgi:arylsulfatase B